MKRSAALCATLLAAITLLAPAVAPPGTHAAIIWGTGTPNLRPVEHTGADSDSPAHPAPPVPMIAIPIGFVNDAGDAQVLRVKVRTAPHLDGKLVAQLPIGTPLRIYARVAGDAATKKDRRWYRISPPARAQRYIYGGYVRPFVARIPERGKVIVVSLRNQWLLAFQNGRLVLDSPVTTGRPELPTPPGVYRVLAKYAPYRMVSPWPSSSPFYYPATSVRYALQFRADGYFIHDAGWRSVFGPGTNLPHRDPGDPLGSHGCVNVPTTVERTLFRWAGVGTTIEIVG